MDDGGGAQYCGVVVEGAGCPDGVFDDGVLHPPATVAGQRPSPAAGDAEDETNLSRSAIGQVIFNGDTEIYRARQRVTKRLQQAQNKLPEGVETPQL